MGNNEKNIIAISTEKIMNKLKESGWDVTKAEADKLGKEEVMRKIIAIYKEDREKR